MPQEIKEEKVKELAQLKGRAHRKEQIETERKMAKKYKLVKFIGAYLSTYLLSLITHTIRTAESRP